MYKKYILYYKNRNEILHKYLLRYDLYLIAILKPYN